jgi:colanic acid/amylovoran biosynthesis glycosyltransferase
MHSQVTELQRLGVNAHVVCERTENRDQFGVANIHCLDDESMGHQIWYKGLRKLRHGWHLGYLVRVGRETGAQIVHSHFGNVGWTNLGVVRKLNTKHVVTFYGFDVSKLPRQFPIWHERYRVLFAEADLILCEGSHMARCIVGLGCPAQKVRVQHLGVDIERFDFRPRHWRPGETLRVLMAASFREKKGSPLAIEALYVVMRSIPIELTIIGDAGKDEASQREKEKIHASLVRTGLKPFTRLLGYQSHARMLEEAFQHHVFLHPSISAEDGDTEGGAPVCITEMMATGITVVSTTHCDIPEVVGSDLHHLLAPERNVEALVGCLKTVIQNPSRWGEWALIGRRRIEAEYHQGRQAERLMTQYKKLVPIV